MIGWHWTVASFFIFLLYLTGSVQSWRTTQDTEFQLSRSERLLWVIAAIVLCAMAANVAFGALDRVANSLRVGFRAEGWYRDRMPIQIALLAIALLFSCVTISVALYWSRTMPTSSRLTLMALITLITFVIVRAVSLHALDGIIYARISGITISTALELGVAALILLLISWRRVAA